MKKPSKPDSKAHSSDPVFESAAAAPSLSKQDIDALWDIVIRAHYLAHEMRHYCRRYGQAWSVVANVVADNLENWATRLGAELESREPSRASSRAKSNPAPRGGSDGP